MVKRVAARIDEYYRQRGVLQILLVGILKGANIFHADLLRELETAAEVDFMQVSSYIGMHSSGELTIHKDINADIAGRHVLLVEDIVDTGFTLSMLMERLQQRKPADIRLCAALDKAAARKYPVQVDFAGMPAPEKFLVGYGLDYQEHFRGLPYIGELIFDEKLPEK